jgi:hypothetical protein
MNARAHVPSPQQDREFALELIRICSRRLKEIDQEITTIGTALAQGRMPPRVALMLVDQVAPSCIPRFISRYSKASRLSS